MKKSLITLITFSSILIAITACNQPTNNSVNPSASPSTAPSSSSTPVSSSTPSVGGISKESVIAVYNCVKEKSPELALVMNSYIVAVNAQTDDKWAINAGPTKDGLKRLEAYGCFYK